MKVILRSIFISILSLSTYSQNIYTSSLNSSLGIIRTPSIQMNEEGTVSFLYTSNDPLAHGRISLSPYEWFEGSFFYYDMNTLRYNGKIENQSNKDKGFSAKIRILKENDLWPAIVVGFEDLAGTGYFSSEYIVAGWSKERFNFNFGLGWGRLGSTNDLRNPFSYISDSFNNRENFTNKKGGNFEIDSYFSGPTGIFSSMAVKLLDQNDLLFKIEYDSNDFTSQRGYNALESSRINYGLSFKPFEGAEFGVYQTEGNDTALNFSYKKNFSSKKPPVINQTNPYRKLYFYDDLINNLKNEGVLVQKASVENSNNALKISYIQLIHNNEKHVAQELYKNIKNRSNFEIEEIIFYPKNGSITTKEITINEKITLSSFDPKKINHFDFTPKIIFPFSEFSVSPSLKTHIGSPAGFFFWQLVANLNFNVGIKPYLDFESVYNIPILDNFEELSYNPNATQLPQVRTKIQDYLTDGGFGFERLKINRYFNPQKNNYFLISAGHLEDMFSGFFFEYLHKEIGNNVSFGAEVSFVKQRKANRKIYAFDEYKTATFHLNLNYYNERHMLDTRISVGRYLAQDLGLTIETSRVFSNGARIGAFFSKTNISSAEFGEGSFDKGIFLSFPTNLFSKSQSKGTSRHMYKPILRDGAAKLNHSVKLLDVLYDDSDYRF